MKSDEILAVHAKHFAQSFFFYLPKMKVDISLNKETKSKQNLMNLNLMNQSFYKKKNMKWKVYLR